MNSCLKCCDSLRSMCPSIPKFMVLLSLLLLPLIKQVDAFLVLFGMPADSDVGLPPRSCVCLEGIGSISLPLVSFVNGHGETMDVSLQSMAKNGSPTCVAR